MAAQVSTVRTTCPYCGVGCGVLATPDGEGGATISGDTDHPANFGRLCSKGSALGETLGTATRLLHPEVNGQQVSWSEALDHVATLLAETSDRYGPDAIAFYLSGQLLTEDYYVANKFAKGFIGTPHVDTNSRLCMASSVAGHKRAFGEDVVPQCYDDLESADLVVLVGSNTAWCHPVLYQRLQAARASRGTRVVVIDPRRTATCADADLHLPVRPGMDANLWNGLLVHLAKRKAIARSFVDTQTSGLDEALVEARRCCDSAEATAIATGLDSNDIEIFFDWWCRTDKVVTCYSQGVNQSAQGTDKVNAILNCHLATGRIGKSGSGPLSLTGQPNAMGGREVGGLANTLAAHMGFSTEERAIVERFWQAPRLISSEGHKAVEMFEAIQDGSIKALWVMGTNPAVSLPRADKVRDALAELDAFVISENVRDTDTAEHASVRLPAAAWGEKDGTVTNSERRISRQRGFVAPPGEVRPDWWIMCQIARRLGFASAFAYESPADIFREHARLSEFENNGSRIFDIGALSAIDDDTYDSLEPSSWPLTSAQGVETQRLFADGGFATSDGRARLVPIAPAQLAARPSEDWPLILNTGRVRDQWHTMTRSGLSSRLLSHISEPFAQVHPNDARDVDLEDGDIARIETPTGTVLVRAVVDDGQMQGTIFAPIHWSDQNSARARTGSLIGGARDPISGQPEAKAEPARLSRTEIPCHGVIYSRDGVDVSEEEYWSRAVTQYGQATTVGFATLPPDWSFWASAKLPEGEVALFEDASSGLFRIAITDGERLQAVAYFGPRLERPSATWLNRVFEKSALEFSDRRSLLAGREVSGSEQEGSIVCVCFQVGENTIGRAVSEGCCSLESIGQAVQAGTNCGSCRPEIRRLIEGADRLKREAAE